MQQLLFRLQSSLLWCRQTDKRFMVALMVALLLGVFIALGLYWQADKEKAYVQAQYTVLQQGHKRTLQRLAKSDVEAAINRNADYTLRKTLEQQQKTLDEQQRLLEFYSLLMALGKTKEGLELNGMLLRPLSGAVSDQLAQAEIVAADDTAAIVASPRHYSYQFVFVQYAKRHNLLRAEVAIKILGTQDGKARFLNLKDLHQDDENKDGKTNKNVKQFGNLRFKYFQKMEGRLTLPQGFVPEQIVIDATIKKKKSKPWQRIVDWKTEE